ncbi:heat shock protein 70-like protein-like protein [Mytilinidion resinicola]|uniref:Heat shock protein 70-like protein-like protein n=1 Tax=Mytilinidion resinicola TaxID=574789 RepID=A0A6A6Z6D2_9PEZI|nr:heat shock protein 70-like protein-like protein [Mytilinidion resinicola]KAF2816269.1 heat shock protein 70-like protein-like protein [Mytilinidion resinicola]
MAPPGRRRLPLSPLTLILGLLFLFSGTASAASAVLGVDIGTEYIKAALVKPGIPLDIVLTKDSKRKEASAVAFKPSRAGHQAGNFPERFYGGDALALAARFPADVYPNLKTLLGVPLEDLSVVTEYKDRHPALQVVGADGRPTIAFKSETLPQDELPFSVEELLAMELQNVRDNAVAMAGKGNDVSEVVFTIPPFYTADEKRALEAAANLAGLKVLGLVSDGLAVGIQYATSRTFPSVSEGGKPEYHMVFDMGAGSTKATVLKFQGRTVKDVGRFNKTIQEVIVLGTGWDRTLGGDSLNGIVMDDMVQQFVESSGAKKVGVAAVDVKAHGRTASKLLKEAEKVRQVLSANSNTGASFEGLYEDVDFKYKIARTQFEELASDFTARVDGPITQALGAAGLTVSELDSVILHGGAVRTPFIQKRLESLIGAAKLKSNVNADESAVFGAAFKAAGLSPSFRVKEIRDIDIQGYQVGVQYTWNLKERFQKLFTPTSPVGTTKDIPFKMMDEFEFTLHQGIPSQVEEFSQQPVIHVRTGNLTKVVSNLIDKEGCDRETFNTKFSVRLSPVTGVPEVVGGWVSCETEDTGKGGVMEGVKGFFGFGAKDGEQQPLKEGETVLEGEEADSSSTESSSTSSSSTSTSMSSPKSSSASAASESPDATEGKKKTITSAITFHITQKGYEKHPRKEYNRMKDRLAAFDASDKARRGREEVLNSLEAFTYRARDLLDNEYFIAAFTTEQRSLLEEKLGFTSDWIYGDGRDATEEDLKAKLKDLKDIVDPVQKRIDEARKRPDAIKSLEEALEQVKSFTGIIANDIKDSAAKASLAAEEASKAAASSTASAEESATADPLDDLEEEDMLKSASSEAAKASDVPEPPIYSEDDLEVLTSVSETVQKWLDEKLAAQAKLSETQDAAFTIKDLEEQSRKLNSALMEMVQRKMRMPTKSKTAKPKATKKPKKAAKKKSKKGEKAEEEEEVKADGQKARKIKLEPGATMEEIEEAIHGVKKAHDEL